MVESSRLLNRALSDNGIFTSRRSVMAGVGSIQSHLPSTASGPQAYKEKLASAPRASIGVSTSASTTTNSANFIVSSQPSADSRYSYSHLYS